MFHKFVTRRRRTAPTTPATSPITTPVLSPTALSTSNSTDTDRQAMANAQLAVLDSKIEEWEKRVDKQRGELRDVLGEISVLRSSDRKVPDTLKKAYRRHKDAICTTEAQIDKLRVKHEDVAKAAELAILTDAIGNANNVVDGIQPGIDHVGDVLATAASQTEEADLAAQALAEAGGDLDDVDIDDEIEQFELANVGDVVETNIVLQPEFIVDKLDEDDTSEVESEETPRPKTAVPA